MHDIVAFDAAAAMSKRTGQPLQALTKGAAAGTSESSLVGHGVHFFGNSFASFVRVGGQDCTAKELAAMLVNDAKWSGGTLRMVTCQTGIVGRGAASYAEALSVHLDLMGSPTAVLSPQGAVSVASKGAAAGLPVVEGAHGWLAPGAGWTVPLRFVVTYTQLDNQRGLAWLL